MTRIMVGVKSWPIEEFL